MVGLRPRIYKEIKMEDLKFASFEDAMMHLANVTGKKVLVAADASEVKDDLFQLIKKSGSPKYDKSVKAVLGNIGSTSAITVAELVDMLRDAIAKADDDEASEEEK
jgi:lipoate-protein ligase A